MNAAYEVHNPSFNDMRLEQQIEVGINDWCAEDDTGHEFFGRSRDEAEAIRCLYVSHRGPRVMGSRHIAG